MRQAMLVWLAGCALLSRPVLAQTEPSTAVVGDVQVRAASLEFLRDKDLVIGRGDVQVTRGQDNLRADYMELNTETRDLFARGHVLFENEKMTWTGENLRYNFLTRTGDFGSFNLEVKPFYITAVESKRTGTNVYELKDVTLTTCAGDSPDYVVRAKEAVLTSMENIRAKGATLYVAGVPVFYWPTYSRNLKSHDRYWEFMPGYSTRHGAFLLSAYNYKLAPEWRGRTRLDLRTTRGIAGGEDILWKDDEDQWQGEFNGYYAQDQEPIHGDGERAVREGVVDEERYRLRLQHSQVLADRDTMLGEANYLSDPYVLRDFFDDEYRTQVQPENRLAFTHRGDAYTAGLLFNGRLNDFYENIDRLPEATFEVPRLRIAGTPLYYETYNSAGWLQHVYADDQNQEDYDAARVDSAHMVYWPTRQFGFLTLTPRAGYRGTYYSDTYATETVTNTVLVTGTNGVASVSNDVRRVQTSGGSDLRNLYELGFETSFKAFRAWEDYIVLDGGDGLRHIAEPYFRYTYTPEPNVLPSELPQFDSVDELGERNDLRIGMRNKLQTRYDMIPSDFVDADIYTYYRFYKEEGWEDFSDIYFDVDLVFDRRFPLELLGAFDPYGGDFSEFSGRFWVNCLPETRSWLEYLYRRDDTDLVQGGILLFPESRWSFDVYWRYDFELGELEEQSYFIQRKSRCVAYGLGVKEIDDEIQGWIQVWLLAFPGSNLHLGG